jgi:hypothetical protein
MWGLIADKGTLSRGQPAAVMFLLLWVVIAFVILRGVDPPACLRTRGPAGRCRRPGAGRHRLGACGSRSRRLNDAARSEARSALDLGAAPMRIVAERRNRAPDARPASPGGVFDAGAGLPRAVAPPRDANDAHGARLRRPAADGRRPGARPNGATRVGDP